MFRTSRITIKLAFAAAILLVLTACQAGAGSPASSASAVASAAEPTPGESQATAESTVEIANSASLGDYLADAEGRTLYIFLNDSPGVTSCFDSCLQTWPAFTVGSGITPTAGAGISGALGTIERDDGSVQVTLEGWPLYYFAADAAPGDTNGQGVGSVWFVARPDGSVPGAGAASQGGYNY
ncbi:MAG TPA: hypothetical protein VK838_05810 [Candidatus Limnocylindrales bacterium]|nr:hypothetical protein [Candidatus Limnocylindrales bacterium]